MATLGSTSRATATGLVLTMIAVSAGVSSSAGVFAMLLSFAGVLAGACFIFVGVRMDDDPTALAGRPAVVVACVGALVHCLRRNLGLVGLLLASSAVSAMVADWEAAPVLCFSAFAVLLLGLSLLNTGAQLVRFLDAFVVTRFLIPQHSHRKLIRLGHHRYCRRRRRLS